MKAQTGISTIKTLIIFSIVSIILIIFAVSIVKLMNSSSGDNACKLSIIAGEKITSNVVTNTILSQNIKCPYNDVKIDSRKETVDDDFVNRVFVEELYNCYVKTAEGKHNPFGKNWAATSDDADSACVVCSLIDTSDISGKTLNGLNLFLLTKNVPGQKISFFESMHNTVISDARRDSVMDQFNAGKDSFKLGDEYLVFWRISRENVWSRIGGASTELIKDVGVVGLIFPRVTGAAVGVLAGAGVAYEFFSDENNIFYSNYYILPSNVVGETVSEIRKELMPGQGVGGESNELFCGEIIMQAP